MTEIPEDHRDLLERPLFAHLATMRPDGQPQVNPMWFSWDGEYLRFTNTKVRQKYRNIAENPRVAVSITDPDNEYRYLEVRGTVVRVEDDPEGAFFTELAHRYGAGFDAPPEDARHRVVFVVKPAAISKK